MIDSVPLIQNANDAQQINASIIAMKKASRELDEKIAQFNKLFSQEITNREKAITEAINSLDVPSVGGSGKYISAISETDGKISATESEITSSVSSGNSQPVTSGGVAEALNKVELITNGNPNNLYPSENNKIGYYQGIFTSNVPDTHTYQAILTSVRTLRADSSYTEIYQEYEVSGYSNIGNYTPIIYTRYGYFSGSGSGTPTWSDWQKIIRAYDLGGSALKYKDITFKLADMSFTHVTSYGRDFWYCNIAKNQYFTGTQRIIGAMIIYFTGIPPIIAHLDGDDSSLAFIYWNNTFSSSAYFKVRYLYLEL